MRKKAIKSHSFGERIFRFFLYAASGALTALPLVFPVLWFIGWVAPAPVLYCELYKKPPKDTYIRSYFRGMSFFWFFGVLIFHWFFGLYPLDFLGFESTDAMITVLLASLGIPLLQALVSSLIFVGLAFIRKSDSLSRHPLLSGIFCASLFASGEYMHTLTPFGVPWGRLAVGQTGWLPIIQSISLFGSYFITFLMILFVFLTVRAFAEHKGGNKKKAIVSLSIALFIFFSNITFGCVKMAIPEKNTDTVNVAAVQGNIRFEDKWADKAAHTMDIYGQLTEECSNNGAELIIWPETALPYDMTESYRMENYFSELGKAVNCEVIVTCFESDKNGVYNTARLVTADGTIDDTVYKKRHLVPFGEYIPLEGFVTAVFPPLTELCSTMEQITPGSETEIIETKNGKLGMLICFDSIYEDLCRQSSNDGAELIAISTNDSWFTGTCALQQHHAQARLRAVENGRYIVRSANTGISSVISPTGEITDALEENREGYVVSSVRFIKEKTLYTVTGNVFLLLCFLYLPLFVLYVLIDKKKRKKK